MEDFDIEPPKAPRQGISSSEKSSVPTPPKRHGLLKRIFKKETKTQNPELSENVVSNRSSKEHLNEPFIIEEQAPDLRQLHEESLGHDEILPPPQLDEFNQTHAEELSKLKEKLGIEEFVIPTEGTALKTRHMQESKGLLAVFKERKAPQEPTEDTVHAINQSIYEAQKIETVLENKYVENKLLQPNPIDEFHDTERQLAGTPELPAPPVTEELRQPLSPNEQTIPEVRALTKEEIQKIITALSQQDQESVKMQKAYPAYLTFLQQELHEIIKAPSAYTNIVGRKKQLEQAIHAMSTRKKIIPLTLKGRTIGSLTDAVRVIDRLRDAEFSILKKEVVSWVSKECEKKQLATALYQSRTRREFLTMLKEENKKEAQENRKKKRDIHHAQQAISLLEAEEKLLGTYNIGLFFKLHKATSLESMLRLLKTMEYLYKLDLDTIMFLGKKDFERWAKSYLALEKKRQEQTLLTAKQELQTTLTSAAAKMKEELARVQAELKEEQENMQHEQQRAKEAYQQALFEKEQSEIYITRQVNAITANIRKEQEQLKRDYELKHETLVKEREAFLKLQQKQDLDVYAELQRVEKIRKAVEAERFMFEEDKAEFEGAKKVFQLEKKNTLDDQKRELAKMRAEWKMLSEKTATEKKKLDILQKEYGDKIKKEFQLEAQELEKARTEFAKIKDREGNEQQREQARLNQERLDLEELRKEVNSQQERVTSMLTLQKAEIKTDLEEMHRIDTNLERMESLLHEERARLEKEGMDKYIHARLTDLHPLSPPHVLHTPDEDMLTQDHQTLFEKITRCRALLNQRNITDARTLYKEIKELSQKMNIHHRSELHTLMKELSTDISLSCIK